LLSQTGGDAVLALVARLQRIEARSRPLGRMGQLLAQSEVLRLSAEATELLAAMKAPAPPRPPAEDARDKVVAAP
jgi:hypothetical protein